MELWLPEDKLERVQKTVQEWLEKDSGRKRDLESRVGLLQHAASAVWPGCCFVRIIEEMAKVKKRNYHVHFNEEIKSDLLWWYMFLEHWNGVGLLPSFRGRTAKVYSDASGGWGGAQQYSNTSGCSGSGDIRHVDGTLPQRSSSQQFWLLWYRGRSYLEQGSCAFAATAQWLKCSTMVIARTLS